MVKNRIPQEWCNDHMASTWCSRYFVFLAEVLTFSKGSFFLRGASQISRDQDSCWSYVSLLASYGSHGPFLWASQSLDFQSYVRLRVDGIQKRAWSRCRLGVLYHQLLSATWVFLKMGGLLGCLSHMGHGHFFVVSIFLLPRPVRREQWPLPPVVWCFWRLRYISFSCWFLE